MYISNEELIEHARSATNKIRQIAESREEWRLMGCVGAALVTSSGALYTGVNIHLLCGMGICAEYSAIAEMIKNGETEIKRVAAITASGSILPPCGKCREMLYQIDKKNVETEIVISTSETRILRELLPFNWQENFDKSL
jgi:cytidine deaminase